MHKSLPDKTKQFFFVLIKLSIVVGAFYFIYHKLLNNDSLNFNQFWRFLNDTKLFSVKNSLFLVGLSVLNWFFEITKWRYLVSKARTLSFLEATAQSLGSLTASLFTPNRIGEYGAKAIYYLKPLRKRILLINLISNMMQMGITVILGSIGFLFYYKTYEININYFKLSRGLLILIALVTLVSIGITQSKYKIKGFSLIKIYDFTYNLGIKYLTIGLLLSLVRYVIFSFQFYFILSLFNVPLHYWDAMIIITTLYLLASIIPSITIFDVLIKGSVAIYLFSLADITALPILSCVLLMWLLNFALPSIVGSYFVLNFNLPKTKN
ncbi:lysylphosphatidylglycerol synthase domain-containing protein [Olleya sp. Bg11-27]|uniref:lysylphosphatidylglycerol synthase domain-containing protein n=1 Tax=Olleya sp. Bg11-27 TaxID=2058135 RepID=UPI000C309940|nr:lysylphosphatidylglycerol synthase domain-containing protein [Olleya sp. Bg11-27]AUC74374.1 hypothetical protein CW732_01240 [Olleya sp. Bg11-27]